MRIEKEICSDGEAGLDDDALSAAKRAFGISYLYPWQRLVIANIIDAYRSRKTETNNASAAEADGITTDVNDDGAQKSNDGSAPVAAEADDITSAFDIEDAAEYGKQIVLLPTGAGKSLCFLVPALLLDGPTLIIYPLLALMADQRRRMEEGNIGNVTFRGSQSAEARVENFNKIKL